jgi:hypothetical protein
MKRVIWFLILVAVAYFAWKYYPEVERMARERAGTQSVPPPAETQPASKSTATPTVAPARSTAATTKPAAPAEAFDPEIERRYPMPEFKPIEALVGNWLAIPPSAFPRQVILQAPVSMVVAGGVGTARLDAGSKVLALGAHDGRLAIAPAIDSPVRGQVAIDQTNYKQVINDEYDRVKERKREEVLALRRTAQGSKVSVSEPPSVPGLPALLDAPGEEPPAAVLAKIGPRPAQDPDRTVPIVVASINERQLAAARNKRESEPKVSEIKSWGRVHYRDFEGQPYWAATVRYTARTIFGEFPAEAVALIRRGKVEKWVYAGTGEPVF